MIICIRNKSVTGNKREIIYFQVALRKETDEEKKSELAKKLIEETIPNGLVIHTKKRTLKKLNISRVNLKPVCLKEEDSFLLGTT